MRPLIEWLADHVGPGEDLPASPTGDRLDHHPPPGAPRLRGRGRRRRRLRRLLRRDRRHLRAHRAADVRAVGARLHRRVAVRLHRCPRGRRLAVVRRRDRRSCSVSATRCTGSAWRRCSALRRPAARLVGAQLVIDESTAMALAHDDPDDPRPGRLGVLGHRRSSSSSSGTWPPSSAPSACRRSVTRPDWGSTPRSPAAFLALLWPRLTTRTPRLVAVGWRPRGPRPHATRGTRDPGPRGRTGGRRRRPAPGCGRAEPRRAEVLA